MLLDIVPLNVQKVNFKDIYLTQHVRNDYIFLLFIQLFVMLQA